MLLCLVQLLLACSKPQTKAELSFNHAPHGSVNAYISEDGQYSVNINHDNTVYFWNLKKQSLTYIWQQSSQLNDPIYLAHIASNNQYVVTAASSAFALWDAHSGKNLGYWQVKDAKIRDIKVNNAGSAIFIAQSDGKIIVFNPNQQSRLEFYGHSHAVNHLDIDDQGEWVLSVADDYSALYWHAATGKVKHKYTMPSRIHFAKLLTANLGYITTTTEHQIIDLHSGVVKFSLAGLDKTYTSAAYWYAEQNYLITGHSQQQINLWDIKTGKRIKTWSAQAKSSRAVDGGMIQSLAIDHEYPYIVSQSSIGFTEYWKIP
ncbi:WD-40 repeat-containing protein [Catenovulum agarivorans DS-2]|uniref:WD-40 repeat-containing protein n=2 Tax=Catenovulum agarivorans TaxID=1172192 RepID=W7QEI0_9ALTE|nr:WD-40 repeat-containing protein [Catenovulum agarivorans DS-2]